MGALFQDRLTDWPTDRQLQCDFDFVKTEYDSTRKLEEEPECERIPEGQRCKMQTAVKDSVPRSSRLCELL
jgi:hypothetical protein